MTAKDTRAWVEAEKLLSELRASNPIYGSETDASPCCIFCGCLADNPGATPESHDPTCLWRRVHERAAATVPFLVRANFETLEQFDKRVRGAPLALHSHDFECPSCGERGWIELDPNTTGTFPCPRACGAQFIEYPIAPDQWRIVCVVQPGGRAD